ncbi:PA-phosphatase related-family protein-like protein [Emericellopsis cladophorae]|uniref:PA-phosphatase related-family protein-like protein n=1 Tax=Emericellopsis cladophorae TaxID=2686198 RepID=A0A9Q0BHA2_9HYPO|nr:PA-phosphatase related-family protein-like protein [Emericellopsis cladophorae]KAI6785852.1 PA-phosphatase related-family protein-like protein [Emericellopsis cladophorae]
MSNGSFSKTVMSSARQGLGGFSWKVFLSYALDWIVLVALGVVGYVLGKISPNKRPFSLNDPEISFPHTDETVPVWLLAILMGVVPIVLIFIVCLIFIPGATVPRNTPQLLIWKRKLWELHVGWLGLALSVIWAFFFTSAMKNLFGKPRPDLLSRCDPDFQNAANYVVGGFQGENTLGVLYSASICQTSNLAVLDEGFRSYPSGHSSTSAAGLVYLTLFLASKFAVTIPYIVPSSSSSVATRAAFPSRLPQRGNPSEQDDTSASWPLNDKDTALNARHNAKLHSVRRQAAAPPIYLLALTLTPFALSIFISASRWWDFRHHGFDILFGYLMGLFTAVYSFRYYHLPIQEGAGWAWGPRSSDRAFWAGVGRVGYSGVDEEDTPSPVDALHKRNAESNDVELGRPQGSAAGAHMTQRPGNGGYANEYAQNGAGYGYSNGQQRFDDVEMDRMDSTDHGTVNRI